MSISTALRDTICSLIEQFWLPGACLLCAGGAREALCPACLAELPEQQPGAEVLAADAEGGPLQGRLFAATFERSEREREEATRERPAVTESGTGITALTLWRYVEPADRVVLAFKYGGHATVARLWAARVAGRLPAVDALIAMPMHRTRLAERGENPAAVMARALRPLLPGRPPLLAATKTRLTARQQGLDREGRLANVAGAYRVDADLRGRHVLLVDDVLTTGASLLALAAAARAAGAAAVHAVAMARAAP
ncbi:MAG: ComF family protein [Rhodocyclaceae bacterium]|nr:ComF family protein [Rhodocyclaceae bacterium]